MKRLLSVLLVLCMSLSCCAVSAWFGPGPSPTIEPTPMPESPGAFQTAIAGILESALGSAPELISGIQELFGKSQEYSDDYLRSFLWSLGDNCGITLPENQINALISLLRSLEKNDSRDITKRIEDLQKTFQKAQTTTSKVLHVFRTVRNGVQAVAEWVVGVVRWFKR